MNLIATAKQISWDREHTIRVSPGFLTDNQLPFGAEEKSSGYSSKMAGPRKYPSPLQRITG
ncbi:hypothetical protein [Hyphomonas sp.]|uniref:hypothetical protein n=1 Tax=Hyphomonas sp. TaxID=87 RepID=UPI002353CA6B|nr:hypothetical protein [Hyphomonas sp.]